MLPPTTKLPNASTTWPASPSSRIRRVTDTLIARRKSVVSSRIVGNDEKSSARGTYIVATTIISAAEMFSVMKKSSSSGGSGMISIATIRTMPPAAARSACLPILRQDVVHAAALRSAGDAVDVGEKLRHGVEHVLGDLTPDLDVGVQRARQRRVGDDHDAGVLGGFTDLEREIVDTLGDDDGCRAAALVLERDGVVGGVRDDHVCGGNCVHHSRAGELHRPSAAAET